MESGQKRKDFFQPLFLDSPDPEQFTGSTKSPDPGPFRDQRGRSRIGDSGDPRKLPHARPVDIDPVSQEIFLADTDGRPSRDVDGCAPERIFRGFGCGKRWIFRWGPRETGLDRPISRGKDIPDQKDQG
jgi:hypothetical protein